MAKTVSITISAQDNFSAVFQKYSSAIGEAASQNTQVANTTKQTGDAMSELTTNIQGAIVAYAGMKGIQAIGDLIDQGQQVNILSQVFSELTKNIGGAAENMAELRRATGGTTDDLTLMAGANRLLQMGLASNTDELSKLSGMAIKLGSSMGMDAKKSFDDFSLMLANNSIMRLDQFGISSGRVRARMEDLRQTMEGIDKSEAFKLAVLEEGAAALDRLGDAAKAAETPLNRVQTRVKNIADTFAGEFATSVNSLAGIIEIASGQNPIQLEQERQKQEASQAAAGMAVAYADRFKSELVKAFEGSQINIGEIVGTGGLPDQILQNAFANYKLGATATDAMQQAFSNLNMNDTVGYSDEDLQRIASVTLQMVQQAENAERTQAAQQATAEAEKQMKEYLATALDDRGGRAVAERQAADDFALQNGYENIANSDLAQTSKNGKKLNPSEITSGMKTDIQDIAKNSKIAGDNIDKMADAIEIGAKNSERIKHALDNIESVQQITFKFTADDPQGIIGMIKAMQGGTSLAEIVRSNGGSIPGAKGGGKHAGKGGV